MLATKRSHMISGHETTAMEEHASDRMERTFIEMEENLKKMTLEMEDCKWRTRP